MDKADHDQLKAGVAAKIADCGVATDWQEVDELSAKIRTEIASMRNALDSLNK